jgi:SpoVK/Ycf46/Vps4 family AAA+-type ATPase
MIAAKKRSVLENLLGRLERFTRAVYRPRQSILVVNTFTNLPMPTIGWNDLILPEAMAEDIRASVEAFLHARASYRALGLPHRRGFLFTGPAGCGKTTAIRVIASQSGVRVLALSLKEDLKDFDVERAFKMAADMAPSILLIEDLDKMVRCGHVSMSFLLNLLDGLQGCDGFLVLATANEPQKLDEALLHRPSRFDRIWHFDLPGLEERRKMLEKRGRGQFSKEAIDEAAQRSGGFTLAYVQEVAVSALLQAIHNGRSPRDSDLVECVTRLRTQFRTSGKASGSIQPLVPIGFQTKMNGKTTKVNGDVADGAGRGGV